MTGYICRLCLHGTANPDHLISFSKPSDLTDKVQRCLGVYVTSATALICTNCKEIVHMIDEFRSLCQRTNQLYDSFRAKAFDELEYWRYQQSITDIRHFIENQLEAIPVPNPQESSCKIEPDLDIDDPFEKEAANTTLTGFAEVLIKEEPLKRKKKKASKNSEFTKMKSGVALKIAREVQDRLPHLAGSAQIEDDHPEWNAIADQFGLTLTDLKKIWTNMKTNYQLQRRQQETEQSGYSRVDRWKKNELFNIMHNVMTELTYGTEKVDHEPPETKVPPIPPDDGNEESEESHIRISACSEKDWRLMKK